MSASPPLEETFPPRDPRFDALASEALAPASPPEGLEARLLAATCHRLPAQETADETGAWEAALEEALAPSAPDLAPPPALAERTATRALAAGPRAREAEAPEAVIAEALRVPAPHAGELESKILEATLPHLPGRGPRIAGRLGRRRLRELAAAAILVIEAGIWFTIVSIAEDARALSAVDAELSRAVVLSHQTREPIDRELDRFQAQLGTWGHTLDAPFATLPPPEFQAPAPGTPGTPGNQAPDPGGTGTF